MKRLQAKRKSEPPESAPPTAGGEVVVLIGTRKGGFILRGDKTRRNWKLVGPTFLGQIINHIVWDARDGRTLLAAVRTGHLGPTVYRSLDFGKTWKEAAKPPAFPKSEDGKGKVVDHIFWLTPGHASETNVWYAGSSPPGLFRSEDGGQNWEGVAGFNENPATAPWKESGAVPDSYPLHSIIIDPRDANHMYLGLSTGGFFESYNKGADWQPLNQGCAADFIPTPNPEYGHDPHCVKLHPLMPDRLYQQNHCGIYRMERSEGQWIRIGNNMPKKVGDIGFPIVLHPRNPDTVWVFPMDGTTVWPRTSPDGKPSVYVTRNAGQSWKRQDQGLPPRECWYTVKRQAMAADTHEPLGLYFGTTSGDVWASRNEGDSWKCLASHLPHIYSIEVAEPRR